MSDARLRRTAVTLPVNLTKVFENEMRELRAYKIELKDQKTRIHNYKQQVAALQKRVGK